MDLEYRNKKKSFYSSYNKNLNKGKFSKLMLILYD